MLSIETLTRDFRLALRGIRRSPGFSGTVVLVLAVGIGATVGVFAASARVLLEPLPFRQGRSLVYVFQRDQTSQMTMTPPLDVAQAWQERSHQASLIELLADRSGTLVSRGVPEAVRVAVVSADLLSHLGVQPVVGRSFGAGDTSAAAARVVMISRSYWIKEFGGDQRIIGQTVTLDGAPVVLLGVLPESARLLSMVGEDDVWLPLSVAQDTALPSSTLVLARLREGSSRASLQSELDGIAADYRTAHNVILRSTPPTTDVVSPRDDVSPGIRQGVILLGCAAGLLFALCLANIGNLYQAQSPTTRRDAAIRQAMGASWGDLVQQRIVEGLTLSTIAGVLGVALGAVGMGASGMLRPGSAMQLNSLGLDPLSLTYAFVVSIATGIGMGLWSAFAPGPRPILDGLRSQGATNLGPSLSRHMNAALVVVQVAMTSALLICAGLLLRSVWSLQHQSLGFAKEGVVVLQPSLPRDRFGQAPARAAFWKEALDKVLRDPQVGSAALSSAIPTAYGVSKGLATTDHPQTTSEHSLVWSEWQVDTGFFSTLGIRILAGAPFSGADYLNKSALPVIVSQTLAKDLWGGAGGIGKYVVLGRDTTPRLVIGIANDLAADGFVARAAYPQVYVPMDPTSPPRSTWLIARSRGDAEAVGLIRDLRTLPASVDGAVAIKALARMQERLTQTSTNSRAASLLLFVLAAIALFVSTFGLAGLLSYVVSRRRRELAIRLAIGGLPKQVASSIVFQGVRALLVGLAIGLVGAAALGRVLSHVVYGVGTLDPIVIVGVVLVLGVSGAVACFIPAKTASRLDPAAILRND